MTHPLPTEPLRPVPASEVVAGPWGPRDGRIEPGPEAPQGADPKSTLVWNLISTLLTAAFLTWKMGPIVALGGVLGIFVHEFGHVLAMNRMGCGPARIRIIPFLGGAAVPARAAATQFQGVLIALAGPVFGLMAILPFVLAMAVTGDADWMAGAFFVAFINLLNLVPAPALDGSKAIGPVLAHVHPQLERGVLLLIGVGAVAWAASTGSYLLAAFLGLSVFGAVRAGVTRRQAASLSQGQAVLATTAYLAAAALCLVTLAASMMALGLPFDAAGVLKVFGFGR